MTIFDVDIDALTGGTTDLDRYRGSVLLVVNVASRCGLTPQYDKLQPLYDTYRDRGLVVLGAPCDQFGHQEPGTATEIDEFCRATYGVTFPMTAKIEVNGAGRHPLYQGLVGDGPDIQWNFEKFVVAPDGTVAARFAPGVEPDDPELVATIEKLLPH
ncbi:glutathione peroxidase [Actinoplanes sp. SE50]|uniref:glutathione peroxidase n=1 Tax=unclassified Actinoplanes TaxID=2626549 RepID=UPI00023EC908|nr:MULTISPECIES: glutathione peroxidase [unclassified Actinoplanes]AEV82593.1 glutathione peroxidase [Actinoplanes sp. SE50/110]ATO80989.1 glutathione peroxidase [Actinoplanes sp. SE50]SLL98396.1 glutathione peroxidase [Actinoplanes sp. SE50/110]